METPSCSASAEGFDNMTTSNPQLAMLEFIFPGFSMFTGVIAKYLHIDIATYIPMLVGIGAILVAWRYTSEYFNTLIESYLMSSVDVRPDDEIYNMIMGWVAAQQFSRGARRFIANTNLNSRYWWLWRWDSDDDNDDDEGGGGIRSRLGGKNKQLSYTPTFGSHYFWYRNHILIFRRSNNRENAGFLSMSEREEITISTFGRNPWVLKELLHEAREDYTKRDEKKTIIYRGTLKATGDGPTWQRCMARTARPFSTVILNEKVKQDLIDDVTDYLEPQTRRWYANRGIPYRRGYLLYGPPGTGKSSVSLALAGYFRLKIYIVSLSSPSANEENLSSLFADLPRKCVVLLEDIDTAGLTHTREQQQAADAVAAAAQAAADDMVPGQLTKGNGANTATGNVATGRLSLSGLLNILDGVASQEGRVLIMTTNHVEKLDKALIRPGRVDMICKFDLADEGMIAAIFRAIYAPLEGDRSPIALTSKTISAADVKTGIVESVGSGTSTPSKTKSPEKKSTPADLAAALEAEKAKAAEAERKRAETTERVAVLSEEFARAIPAHEFSPAELQGYLMKNKRSPEAAIENAAVWVEETRKEKKEKEVKEAEEKRAEEEKKRKEEEEKKKKEEEEKRKKERKERREKKKKEEAKRRKAAAKAKAREAALAEGKEVPADEDDSTDSDSSDDGSESPVVVDAVEADKKDQDKEKPKDGKRDSGYGTPAST